MRELEPGTVRDRDAGVRRRRMLVDALALANAVLLLAGSLFLYGQGADWRFAAQTSVVLAVFAGLWLALRRLDLPVWAILLMQATLLAHYIGRYMLADGTIVYANYLAGIRIDKIVHTLNGAAGSVLVLLLVRRAGLELRGWEAFFVVMTVCGLGTIVEIIEYGTWVLAPVSFAGDYANNMQDLISNLIGAIGGYILARGMLSSIGD
jgi:hypothetical protein